jgi:mannosyltransferase
MMGSSLPGARSASQGGVPQFAVRRLPPLLAITALGVFLRVYHIGSKGLWIDEAFSIWMARHPIGEMLDWVARIDQHPPLYYLLLHCWMRLGGDPATVRALSALCSALTIPVLYFLGCRLADEKVGLLAALILTVSPFHVRFAQEARMYALLTLNASLALYALLCLVTGSRSLVAWLGYVAFTAATLLTHNAAIFFLLATDLFVIGLHLVRRRRPLHPHTPTPYLRTWFLAQLGVLLLWAPWLPAVVAQSAGVYCEFWLPAPTWETVAGAVGAFVSDFLPLPFLAMCAVSFLYAGLAVLGLARLRRCPALAAFLLVVFATPFAGELLVSLRRPIFYARTLIWASLPLYLLLAAGIRQMRRWPYVLTVILTMLAINGLSLREYYVNFEKEQWDDAAALVAERVTPNDLILFNATWAQIPFDYYFHRLYNGPVAEHGVPVDFFDRGVLEPKMAPGDLPRLQTLIQGRERVWLVYSHDWYTDPEGLIPPALKKELALLERWDFYGLQVWLYGEEVNGHATH